MLSPDPVKRSINPYPYCDNDPVNYNDPTGEIANILVGAGLGGFFGGAAGFLGNAASQLMDGGKFNWRKAAGAAANGAVVGAAKGALVGSGVGVLGAFATDFAAGTVGSALEQGISSGRVDLGESLLSGAGNALSEVLYGTGELKGVKDAFLRGARTGAVMSGIDNIARAAGIRGMEPGINPGGGGHSRGAAETAIPGYTGRDPKGMCGAADPFDLSSGLGNGRGYRSGAGHDSGAGGFSLGGFVRDVLTGAVTGGLGSAGFYGAGKAVEKLRGSVAGRVDDRYTAPKPNHGQGFSKKGYFPKLGERTFEGYVNNNVPQNVETKLFTHSSGFNTNPRNDGHFKRFGTEPNQHGIIGPHVHQPTRNINPNNGVITGKPGSKTKNDGVTVPRAKDIKQLYEYLENGKYH